MTKEDITQMEIDFYNKQSSEYAVIAIANLAQGFAWLATPLKAKAIECFEYAGRCGAVSVFFKEKAKLLTQ